MILRVSGLALVWLVSGGFSQGPPRSPCPDVFSYQYDNSGGWYGVVTILTPATFSDARLVVKSSIANYDLSKGYGRIEVIGGQQELQEISKSAYNRQRRRIQFMVIFPPINTIPSITEISINDVIFCANHQVSDNGGGVAKISVNYAVSTGLPGNTVNGNEFSVVHSGSQQVQQPVQRPPQQQNYFNYDNYPQPVQRPPQQQNNFNYYNYPQAVQRPSIQQNTWNRPHTQPPPSQDRNKTPPNRKPATSTVPSLDYSDEDTQDRIEPPPNRKPATTSVPSLDYLDEDNQNIKLCGTSNQADGNFLIIQGSEAQIGDWPWHVAIHKSDGNGNQEYICGGTLVSKKHVISAAHCFYNRKKKRIFPVQNFITILGKHNLANLGEKNQKFVTIDKVFLHPLFGKADNYDHDAAVIRLSEVIEFNQFISPVCLWEGSSSLSRITNKAGTVVGWGVDEYGNKAQKLKVAKMPVVSQETCVRSDSFFSTHTSDFTFCAGYRNGTSVCNGDSGGGMIFKLPNQKLNAKTWFLRGVVSISKLDENSELYCDVNSYVVFTDVAKLMNWVKEVMEK